MSLALLGKCNIIVKIELCLLMSECDLIRTSISVAYRCQLKDEVTDDEMMRCLFGDMSTHSICVAPLKRLLMLYRNTYVSVIGIG